MNQNKETACQLTRDQLPQHVAEAKLKHEQHAKEVRLRVVVAKSQMLHNIRHAND